MLVIDCRRAECYQQGHQIGAVNLPFDSLEYRLFELPTTHTPLSLQGDSDALAIAQVFLQSKGYAILHTQVLDTAFIKHLQASTQWETGASVYRAWQPCYLLQAWPEIAKRHKITPKKGIDLACGSGRDSVYLATQGWQMTGVDYLPRALEKARFLANIHQVNVEFLAMDIEKDAEQLLPQRFDLLLVVRYLHRPLFEMIDQLLAPGGVLLFQTFMQEAKAFGRLKSDKHLLRIGELREQFAHYQILRDEIDFLDDGRPLSSFIAQKPN